MIKTDNATYSIEFASGEKIDGLSLSGSMFYRKKPIDQTLVDAPIANPVKITRIDDETGEKTEETHDVMEVSNVFPITEDPEEGEFWLLGIYDVPQQVLEQMKLRADIDYLAMALDIDLG